MEIHKPKPWHGVREFLKEYAIIVIGVLTALAAEQAVEWVHWRHQLRDAQDAMRLELQDDDLPQAIARAAIEKCLAQQLDGIQAAIDARADRAQVRRLAEAYSPPRRTWDEEAWRAAASSQIASHMSPRVMVIWSGPYAVVPALGALNDKEQSDRILLLAGRRSLGDASEAEEERWLVAIENLRHENDGIAYGALTLLALAKNAGVVVSKQSEQRVIGEMRTEYGSCVATPNPSLINPESQLNPAGRP